MKDTITFDKYQIEKEFNERIGKPTVKIINTNCTNPRRAIVAYYNFRTQQQADEYIEKFIRQEQDKINTKKVERLIEKEMVNIARVGDILYSSWGYDRTIIDFYQVTKVTKSTISFIEVAKRAVDKFNDGAEVVAIKDRFVGEEIKNKRVKTYKWMKEGNYAVRLTSYSSASLWDGKSMYETYYD